VSDDFAGLVARCFDGDADARSELVRTYYPRVQAIVHRELEADFRRQHRWILPLFSTRDVVQDVFVGVVDALEGCDFPNEQAFVGYLATLVRNRLLDAVRFHEAHKRDARRDARGADPAVVEARTDERAPIPLLAAELAEQAELLREVLAGLGERHRELIQLRIVDGETFPAIAERLGYASAETARQAFVDAQARLLIKLRARGLRPPGETLR
jgi:RNA polymerase sigma factor (sigma-70 family)